MIAFLWSCNEMWKFGSHTTVQSALDSSLSVQELSVVVHLTVLFLGLFVFVQVIIHWKSQQRFNILKIALKSLSRKETLFISALAVLPSTSETVVVQDAGEEIPVRSIIEPMLAVALVKRLLRRQTGCNTRILPENQLTEESARAVYELRQYAIESQYQGAVGANVSDDELDAHLDALVVYEPAPLGVVESWEIVLRLYGYPRVESRQGIHADFSKKRSVEVLAWLGMNMERPRRSAVRTALWDVEISDASFSTVMSDIRRGLSSVIAERSRSEIFPPTFTDTIDIGVRLTTDFDLLRSALTEFRTDKSRFALLANELSLIRDTPFAGVNYMWADLDGTTTRMVVLALEAACELAEWSKSIGDIETCLLAVKAGLRVMPGHDELLEIRNSFISQRSMSSE